MEYKVLNKKHGKLLNEYFNYIVYSAFLFTDAKKDDNRKFIEYHKLAKGIITQHNSYTETPEMRDTQLVHEWLFLTPNLLFHSYNGFLCGLGRYEDVCSDELMEKTFDILKSFSTIANEEKLIPKFINYVTD